MGDVALGSGQRQSTVRDRLRNNVHVTVLLIKSYRGNDEKHVRYN